MTGVAGGWEVVVRAAGVPEHGLPMPFLLSRGAG